MTKKEARENKVATPDGTRTRGEPVLTVEDVAARLGVRVATVRGMLDRNWLPQRRVARRVFIPAHAWYRWYAAFEVRADA